MLIVKTMINNDVIDVMHIHNKGEIKNGMTLYEIEKPKIKNKYIFHKRSEGFRELVIVALYRIQMEVCHSQGVIEGAIVSDKHSDNWR